MKKLLQSLNSAASTVVVTLSMFVFAPAHATVIIDHSNGGRIDTGWTNESPKSYFLSDDFTLINSATIDEITYYGGRLPTSGSVLGAYVLRIGTAPGLSDVFITTIDNAKVTQKTFIPNNHGSRVDVFDGSFTPVSLNAGTYWLSFYSPGSNLFGAAAVAGGKVYQIGYRAYSGYATDFILSDGTSAVPQPNAVPEPGSLALLGVGIATLALRRRKA